MKPDRDRLEQLLEAVLRVLAEPDQEKKRNIAVEALNNG